MIPDERVPVKRSLQQMADRSIIAYEPKENLRIEDHRPRPRQALISFSIKPKVS